MGFMSNNETTLMRKIQMEATRLGARLFRNNVGLFYSRSGVPTRCGLCPGSADLIGWTADGRFLAVEIKTKSGRLSADQKRFLAAVNQNGGIAFAATSVRSFGEKLNELQGIKPIYLR